MFIKISISDIIDVYNIAISILLSNEQAINLCIQIKMSKKTSTIYKIVTYHKSKISLR